MNLFIAFIVMGFLLGLLTVFAICKMGSSCSRAEEMNEQDGI